MGIPITIDNPWAAQEEAALKVCNWAAPEYGDQGQGTLHKVLSTIAYAVAIWSALEQMKIAHDRYGIAKGYADIAWDKWARFKNAYAPLEDAMIAEITAEPAAMPDYAGAAADYTRFAEFSFAAARRQAGRLAQKYCLCLDVPDFELEAALARDDGVDFGYRYEERRAVARDDVRWNRRSGLLNLGRHLLSQSASYAAVADGALAGAGQAAGAAMSGAISYLGYSRNRQPTYYPAYPQNQIQSDRPGGLLDFGGPLGVADMGPGAKGFSVDHV